MKRLPLLLDDRPSLLVRAGLFALVPVALLILLPILLLLVIALYLSAIFHGARVVVTVVTGKRTPPDFEMQKPHFLEVQPRSQALSDEPISPPVKRIGFTSVAAGPPGSSPPEA